VAGYREGVAVMMMGVGGGFTTSDGARGEGGVMVGGDGGGGGGGMGGEKGGVRDGVGERRSVVGAKREGGGDGGVGRSRRSRGVEGEGACGREVFCRWLVF
jgi:hypothetical protein